MTDTCKIFDSVKNHLNNVFGEKFGQKQILQEGWLFTRCMSNRLAFRKGAFWKRLPR